MRSSIRSIRGSLITAARVWRYAIIAGVPALSAALTGAAADDPGAAAGTPGPDGVVHLPQFVVKDSRILPEPEAWRYARIPNFEIISDASDHATQRLIKDFEMFQTAVGLIWPAATRGAAPSKLIICSQGNRFDAFRPGENSNPETAAASFFFKDREESAIILDLGTRTLILSGLDFMPDSGSVGTTGFSVDAYRQLYREYVHYLLSRIEPRAPAWFEEGLAQIIMAMKFDKHSIVFGKVESPQIMSALAAGQAMNRAGVEGEVSSLDSGNTEIEDRDFNAVLRRRALLPMEKLFAATHDSPEARNPLGNNRWAKQAYAFVHLCLYGSRGRYQKSFIQFVTRVGREPVTEALFKECFGMTYKQMLLTLRGYIEYTDHQYQEFRIKGQGLPEPPPLELRDAADGEVARIKGAALRLAGHPETARNTLIAAYQRGERDAPLLAELGLSELAAGNQDRARAFLEAAAPAPGMRPRACLELARLRYAAALAQPAGSEKRLSTAQLNGVLTPLFAACTQPPPLPEAYDLIGAAWAGSEPIPTRDDVAILMQGVRLFPFHSELVYQTAELCLRAGLAPETRRLAELGLKGATDATVRDRFARLQASLGPP